MENLHNELMKKNGKYAAWHNHSFGQIAQWVLLIGIVLSTGGFLLKRINSPGTLTYGLSSLANAETINTLDYFLSKHPSQSLTGSHLLSMTQSGNTAYYVKWSADSFERYSWDDNYIYLQEDHSGSPDPAEYTFTPGKWMKRQMLVGEQIDVSENYLQHHNPQTCAYINTGALGYKNTLEQHIPQYYLGGNLNYQDVIVLKYDYSNATLNEFERSYYSKEWGFVKWEHYKNGSIINSVVFNQISNSSPILPNTSVSCQSNAPVFSVPQIPTNLNGFVNTLYSCVLNNNSPDSGGYSYWLNYFQNGGLTAQEGYKQFFGYQKDVVPAISNEEFAKKLYGCTLFRTADADGYNNVLVGLNNGNLNRASLVVSILGSDEFKTRVLPKLNSFLPSQSVSLSVPTTLDGMVKQAYGCVLLNKNPEPGGVTYWTGLLRGKAITPKEFYTSFFGYQKDISPISNEQFSKQIYECMLFREADAGSLSNVLNGLNSNTLTRTGLVSAILNSDEFNNGVLSKLQVLQ